jgi:hypothetical protein
VGDFFRNYVKNMIWGVKTMWHEADVIHIIQLFLPSMGELIEMERPHHGVCVLRTDLDGDGTPEIAAAYKWLGETYLLVLKYHLHSWRVAANVKGKGYGIGENKEKRICIDRSQWKSASYLPL